MKKVILIRSNPVNPDSRLEKEADSLGNNGYSVDILAWGRWATPTRVERKENYTIHRIPLKAPLGKKVVLFWPLWWLLEFIWLVNHKWDIVHVADFDCYLPALVAAKLKRKKIIYDIFDFYPEMVMLPSPIQIIFTKFDKRMMNLADAIIVVDTCRFKQIGHEDGEGITVIYNTPNTSICNEIMTPNDNNFHIFYGGGLQPSRDVISMIHIVNDIPGTSIIIAGGGHTNEILKISDACNTTKNATYLGPVPYNTILEQSSHADLLYALYNPSIPNNRLASPNKLFEAMMCGKPIIVNEGVATADKVREENCGLVVPYGDYEALKEAVLTLKNNPELRKELGENGRRAYETKYNWKIMERRLLDLYKSLLNTTEK